MVSIHVRMEHASVERLTTQTFVQSRFGRQLPPPSPAQRSGMLKLITGLLVMAIAATADARQPPARFDWFEYRGDDHLPKPGPGQYANPVLSGFYPDPSVIRVGQDYY